MSSQLRVKAGDRVVVRIPSENLEFEADRVYPLNGTGVAIDRIDKRGNNLGCVDSQRLALVKLDVPFKRTALLGDDDHPKYSNREKKPKFKMMTEMRVPTWWDLLEHETK